MSGNSFTFRENRCPKCEGKIKLIRENIPEKGEFYDLYACENCDFKFKTPKAGI